MTTIKPKLGARDWSAFFGFGTNILVNLLPSRRCWLVLKMPDDSGIWAHPAATG